MDVAVEIHQMTDAFPKTEVYALTAQMKRAVYSIPFNIAEGQGRGSSKEFAYFLSNAKGSPCEVETQLEIARRLKFISDPIAKDKEKKLDEVSRLLNAIRKRAAAAGAGKTL
jgi:four helix bundle protein